MNETQTDTTAPGQSRPGNDSNEGVTLHSPEVQNWSLTTRSRLASYPENPLEEALFLYRDTVGVF